MYLTFSRNTGELLTASQEPNYEQNVKQNDYAVVFFNDYIIIQNREDVDHVGVTYNKSMGLVELVPNQFSLSDEVMQFVELYEMKMQSIEEGTSKAAVKVKENIGFTPLAYLSFMSSMKGTDIYEILLQVQANISGMTEDLVQQTAEEKFERTLKKINIIDASYNTFKKTVEEANKKEDVEFALGVLTSRLNSFVKLI